MEDLLKLLIIVGMGIFLALSSKKQEQLANQELIEANERDRQKGIAERERILKELEELRR